MPISATCKHCRAVYKIIDSAAGRRVKCRRCSQYIYLPGQPRDAATKVSLSDLAALEENARTVEDPNVAMLRYRATVSTMTKRPVPRQPAPKDGSAPGAAKPPG